MKNMDARGYNREITYNKPIHTRRYGNVKSISTDILTLALHCGWFYTSATPFLLNYREYWDNANKTPSVHTAVRKA
jgi:hypothetical protein